MTKWNKKQFLCSILLISIISSFLFNQSSTSLNVQIKIGNPNNSDSYGIVNNSVSSLFFKTSRENPEIRIETIVSILNGTNGEFFMPDGRYDFLRSQFPIIFNGDRRFVNNLDGVNVESVGGYGGLQSPTLGIGGVGETEATYLFHNTLLNPEYRSFSIMFETGFYYYFVNTTNNPFYYTTINNDARRLNVTFKIVNNETYPIDCFPYDFDHPIRLKYHLYLDIYLNSTFYNIYNTRIEILKLESYNVDINDPEFEFVWKEETWDDIYLNFNQYKVRVYDLDDNLLFEDKHFQNYSYYRTINLSSLKLTNNANEPINISLIENGHYQSNSGMSWDLETPNTRPDNLNYSNEGLIFLQNEYQDHDKVMYINSSLSTQYGTDEIQFDSKLTGWENHSTSGYTNLLHLKSFGTTTFSNMIQFIDYDLNNVNYRKYADPLSNVISGWIAINSTTCRADFQIYDRKEGLIASIFISQSNDLEWYDGTIFHDIITDVGTNPQHLTCVLNFMANTGDIYINGTYISTYNFFNNVDGEQFNFLSIGTTDTHQNYEIYYSSIYIGNSFTQALQSLYPSSYFMIDHKTTNYKTDNWASWDTSENPDLSAWNIRAGTETFEVIDQFEGHSNVLKCVHDSNEWEMYPFQPTDSGIVDFWIYPGQTDQASYFSISDGSNNWVCRVIFQSDSYIDFQGTILYSDIQKYWTQWYHISIAWENNGVCNLYLNGELISSVNGRDYPGPEDLRIDSVGTAVTWHLDSLGFSWDNYKQFSGMIYQNYKSNDQKNILNWGVVENENWTRWNNVSDNGCYTSIQNKESHVNTLKLLDKSSATSGKCFLSYHFEDMSTGCYEIFFLTNDSNKFFYVALLKDTTDGYAVNINIYSGKLRWYDTTNHIIANINNNTWYHLHVDIDCSSDTYDIYLNGILVQSDADFQGSASKVDILYLTTHDTQANYEVFFDSIAISSKNSQTWSNIPTAYVQNGTLEFWHNQNGNSSVYFGDLSLHFTNENLTFWNGTDYIEIELTNQINQLWNRYTITWYENNYAIYRNFALLYCGNLFPINLDYFQFTAFNNAELWIDAIDYTIENSNPNYIQGQNANLNLSEDLWCWDAFPNWEPGYYQRTLNWGTATNPDLSTIHHYLGLENEVEATVIDKIDNHKNVLKCYFSGNTGTQYPKIYIFDGNSQVNGHIDFYVKYINSYFVLQFRDNTNLIAFEIYVFSSSIKLYGSTQQFISFNTSIWFHLSIDFDVSNNIVSVSANGESKTDILRNHNLNIKSFIIQNNFGVEGVPYWIYLDAISYSWDENYFPGISTLENTTEYPLSLSYNISELVFPYSSAILPFTSSNYIINISDLYNNNLGYQSLLEDENEIVYTPPNLQECFITIADQQGNYLNWENFKLKLNSSLLYSNIFLRELDTTWNVSIYDRFDNLLTSTIYTVQRNENYIPLTIYLYSLKIYNQQEQFLHVNITQTRTSNFWSSWIAPKFIEEFKLIPGNYNVNITTYENSGSSIIYNVNFQSDDILLISSDNTLASVIMSMQNLNTTLDEQFTYISLNFTNVNSAIGNQTTIIEINFANVNSTFEDILLSQQNNFVFLNSSIQDLLSFNENSFEFANTTLQTLMTSQTNSFVFMNSSLEQILVNQQNSFEFLNTSVNNLYQISENSFVFINSSLNSLISYSENSFVFLNSSIIDLMLQSQNSFSFLNSSISTIEAISLQSFEYLNSSIEQAITSMAQNFTFLNSQIENNQLEILTQFAIIQSNITNSSIDIMNNILAINSSISNLINYLSNNVFLVNDSIYTAILNSTSVLEFSNSQILGNLTISFEQNEYLTRLFQKTMFSELLDWSGAGYNYSIIEDQIADVEFVNNYRNDTLELLLQYQNETESKILGMDPLRIYLPNQDVDYRIKSLSTGEYLTEWQEIQNKSIVFGDNEFIIPATPADVETETNDWIIAVGVLIGILCIVSFIVFSLRTQFRSTVKYEILDTTN